MKRLALSLLFVAVCSFGDTLTFSIQAPEGGQNDLPTTATPYAMGTLTLVSEGGTAGGFTCTATVGDCILVTVAAALNVTNTAPGGGTVNYLIDNQGAAPGGNPLFVFNDVGDVPVIVTPSNCT